MNDTVNDSTLFVSYAGSLSSILLHDSSTLVSILSGIATIIYTGVNIYRKIKNK